MKDQELWLSAVTQGEVNLPVGQVKREAWSSHAGHDYQVWYAIAKALTLKADEMLFLECAEDVDIASPAEINLRQLKRVDASISLNTSEARSALNHFWRAKADNADRNVFFHFITTGEIALEREGDFEKDTPGILVWKAAKTDLPAARKIHKFLKEAPDLSTKLKTFLNKNGAAVQKQLIVPFTWEANALSVDEIEALVEDKIFYFADSLSIGTDQDKIVEIKHSLFSFVSKRAVDKDNRSVGKRDLVDLFEKATSVRVPFRDWRKTSSSKTSTVTASDLPIDWKTPSLSLEQWPKSLSNDHEIKRPELDRIIQTIQVRKQSAQLLLGEPGSGKSALLAKLSTELTVRDISHLSLKADQLRGDLTDINQLISGLGERTLIDAIKNEAIKGPFVVVIDQLDAICALVDQRTDRLNLLLSLMEEVRTIPQVHLVASCRPFELQTDMRLQGLAAEKISLELPPWEDIARFVVDEHNNALVVPESAREVLRSPWHLKIYLDLAHPRPLLNSFYDLVSVVWKAKLSRAEAPARCPDLVHLVANRVSDTEELWVPDAIADSYIKEKVYLLAEGILKETQDHRLISFRHQTFYDFFLLRSFLQKGTSLVDHIKSHQQSFFIRPTVVRALAYLRATHTTEYAKVLSELFEPSFLRPHLRSLLMEFIGQHRDPLPEEERYILPLLDDHVQGQRVLRVITGSPGWFRSLLLRTDFEEQWINVPTAKAVSAVPVLSAAMKFAEREVVELLVRNWVDNPDYDRLVFNVVGEAKLWEPQLIQAIKGYARSYSNTDMLWISRKLIQQAPEKACPVIGELIRREVQMLIKEIDNEVPSDNDKTTFYYEENSAIAKIKKVVHGDGFQYAGLVKTAELCAVDFLRETWESTKALLLLAASRGGSDPTGYRDDRLDLEERRPRQRLDGILFAVESALTQLAQKDPDEFWRWVRAETSTDSLTIQRLIAKGLSNLREDQYADAVIRHLSEDRRRLYLGTFNNESYETKILLEKFAKGCSEEIFYRVCDQIANIPYHAVRQWKSMRNDLASKDVRGWSRRDRLELLSVLPEDRFRLRLRWLRDHEVKTIGLPVRPSKIAQGLFVGPPTSLYQMENMEDADITLVMNKFQDGVERNDEAMWEDVSRSGGCKQQALEFGRFAVKYPDRAKAQIGLLQPHKHETYAAYLIRKLADPRPENNGIATRSQFPPILPPPEIEALVRSFHQRGFSSWEFRIASADALSHICQKPRGLSSETIGMLRQWLLSNELTDVTPCEIETQGKPDASVLFHEVSWNPPGGRSSIIEAIFAGLLIRDIPAVQECLLFLDELEKSEHNPNILGEIFLRITGLFGSHSSRMTTLFNDLFVRMPELFSLKPVAHAWSEIAGRTDPIDTERDWLEQLLKREDAYHRQLAGELVFVHYARKRTGWAKTMIDEGMNGTHGEYFSRGLAYAAAACLPIQPQDEIIEQILQRALDSQSNLVKDTAQTFITHIGRNNWSARCKRLVMKLIEVESNHSFQVVLCRQLELIFLADPDMCLEAAEKISIRFKHLFSDVSSPLPLAAEHIVNISLTAQRFSRLRDRGLTLFESLLDLNISEARKAASLLNDRDEFSNFSNALNEANGLSE